MGLLLLCMSLAVIVTVPLAGQAVARRGSGPVAVAGGLACAATADLPVPASRSGPVPLLFSAVGRRPDTAPGPAIGAVSLPWALGLLVPAAVAVLLPAPRAVASVPPDHEQGERACDSRARSSS